MALALSVDPASSKGELWLSDQLFFDWLAVERLELEVPWLEGESALTADLAGTLGRLQRRRTRLTTTWLRVTRERLDHLLAARAEELRAAGIDELSVHCHDGYLSVAARVTEGKNTAEVTCRVYLAPRGLAVEVLASHARVYGYLSSPMPVVAHRLCAALLDLPEAEEQRGRAVGAYLPRATGLGQFELAPLHAFLWSTLPPAGWRLPSMGLAALEVVRVSSDGVELAYGAQEQGRESGEHSAAPEAGAIFDLIAANEQLRAADDVLLAGDLDGALRLYRAELAAGGPDQPQVLERILGVESVHPAYFTEAEDLARQTLARHPDLACAHIVIANLAAVGGDGDTAGAHYQRLFDMARDHAHNAVPAALAAARALAWVQPNEAVAMYEQVLAYSPGHREAADALIELYTKERRYFELATHLRKRIEAQGDPRLRAAAHLHLAQVLGQHLRDRRAARVEIERACELTPDDARALAALAEHHQADGRHERALLVWSQLVELGFEQGDERAQIHALVRMADLYRLMGDLERAEARYMAALELDDDHVDALAGRAATATARGDHRAAKDTWERVIARAEKTERGRSDDESEALARYYMELGKSARGTGELDSAIHAFAQAAERGVGALAAEAHAALAELHREAADYNRALAALDAAVHTLTQVAEAIFAEVAAQGAAAAQAALDHPAGEAEASVDRHEESAEEDENEEDENEEGERYLGRAADLALVRATLLRGMNRHDEAHADYQRAHALARHAHPEHARRAARALLDHDVERGDRAGQRRWLDALIDSEPEGGERHDLLLSRAELRSQEPGDTDGALSDVREVLRATGDETKRSLALSLQARLLAEAGDRIGHARTLSDRADLVGDTAARVLAKVEAAEAWLRAEDITEAMDIAVDAVGALNRASERGEAMPEEVRVRALELLGELSWRRRRWPDVARAYGELRHLPADDQARARHAFRSGMALDALGEPERASEHLRELIDLGDVVPAEERAAAWQSLARIHERRGDLLQAALTYENLADDNLVDVGDQVRIDAWCRAGEFHHQAGRVDDACRCLERALEVSPAYLPALDALERIETARADDSRLAQVLLRKLATAEGHEDRQRAVLMRLGQLYQRTGETESARAVYERLLEIAPETPEALRFFTVPAAEEPAQEPADAPVDESVGAPIEESAVEPGSAEASSEADKPAPESALPDVMALRERADAAAERGDHHAHAAALEELAAAMNISGKATRLRQRSRRAEVWQELADLYYDHLGDRSRARRAMLSAADAYGAGSRRDAVLRMLAAEAMADGADEAAVEAYERIDAARQSPADRYSLAACWQRLGRDHRALFVLEEAEEADQLTDQAARLLFLTRQEMSVKAERVAALEARAMVSPASTAAEFLREALELYEESLGDTLAAERVRAILHDVETGVLVPGPGPGPGPAPEPVSEPTPKPEPTFETEPVAEPNPAGVESSGVPTQSLADTRTASALGLPNLWKKRAAERHEQEAEIGLTAEPRPSTPQERLEQLADAALHSGDRVHAAEQLARAIVLRAEKLYAESRPVDDVTRSAVQRLRDIAEQAESFEPLARVLAAVAKVEDDPVSASALWAEVALLYRENLGSRVRSAEALMHAILANPEDATLVHEAEDLFGQLGDYPRLADVYELYAATLQGTERAHVLVALARIQREELEDERRSAECYALAFEADPAFAEAWWPLAELRAREGDTATAIALYEQLLERVDDPENRAEISRRIEILAQSAESAQPLAEAVPELVPRTPTPRTAAHEPSSGELMARGSLLEAQGQWEAAIEAYERAAVKRPNDLLPLEAIARLYDDLGEGEALLQVIDRMLERASEPSERARLYFRQAEICRELLQRDTDSYQYLCKAYETDPGDSDIAYALRVTAMARGEWLMAAHLVEQEIAGARDARDAGALYFELALIYDEKLLDARGARERYERALELDPEIPAAPRPLARLYELEGRFADAAVMHERAAHTLKNTGQRAHLLQRAAECAERASNIDHARALYAAAAEAATNDVDLRNAVSSALERLAHTAARAGSESSAATEREHEIAVLRHRLEEAARAGDSKLTQTLARDLMARDSADAMAYTALAADAEARGDWSALADLLHARAKALAVPDEKAAAYFTLGTVCQLQLHDLSAAGDAYENALRAMPNHPAALESLAGLAFEQRDFARARELYTRLPADKSSLPSGLLAFRLGLIAEGMGDDREALAAFSRAAEIRPDVPEVLAALARVAQRTGALDAAIRAARAQLELLPVGDVQEVNDARLELAKLYAKVGDIDQATHYNELVLSENPRSQNALRALYTLYLERRKFDDAARTLKAIISMTGSLARRAELLYSLGELYLHQMSDFDRAADAYLKGIDLDPEHVPILRRLVDFYWREDEPDELIDIVHALVDQAALLEPETDERTLVRILLTAAAHDEAGLVDSIAEFLGAGFTDALVRVLLETTAWEGEGPPVQALADAVLAMGESRSDIDVQKIIARLEAHGKSDNAPKLVATLRTMYSLRNRAG